MYEFIWICKYESGWIFIFETKLEFSVLFFVICLLISWISAEVFLINLFILLKKKKYYRIFWPAFATYSFKFNYSFYKPLKYSKWPPRGSKISTGFEKRSNSKLVDPWINFSKNVFWYDHSFFDNQRGWRKEKWKRIEGGILIIITMRKIVANSIVPSWLPERQPTAMPINDRYEYFT